MPPRPAPGEGFRAIAARARRALSTNPVDTGVHILYIRALSRAGVEVLSAMPKLSPPEIVIASMACIGAPQTSATPGEPMRAFGGVEPAGDRSAPSSWTLVERGAPPRRASRPATPSR